LYPAVLPLALVHSLVAVSLLAVLLVWQQRALQVQELPPRVQRAEQDHKSLRLRGRQRELAPDGHPKVQALVQALVQAVAQMVVVPRGLAPRAAQPIAQVIPQTHHLSVQVLAGRLHPFGVKVQVKKRPGPAVATPYPPKMVLTYRRVLVGPLKDRLEQFPILPPRQASARLIRLNNRHLALWLNPQVRHLKRAMRVLDQARSRPVLPRPAITVFRRTARKTKPEGPGPSTPILPPIPRASFYPQTKTRAH
jgi:hypothetical protein